MPPLWPGRAVVRAFVANFGDLQYVWRYLPPTDVHPNTALTAETAKVADRQGAFWRAAGASTGVAAGSPGALRRRPGLDVDRFREDLRRHVGAARWRGPRLGRLQRVAGTPTFFINGHRQYCAYDIDTLTAAVRTAKTQAQLDVPNRPRSGRPQAG